METTRETQIQYLNFLVVQRVWYWSCPNKVGEAKSSHRCKKTKYSSPLGMEGGGGGICQQSSALYEQTVTFVQHNHKKFKQGGC